MFRLEMKTEGAAFLEGNKGLEVARILRAIAKEVEAGQTGGDVRDGNVNNVGTWSLKS